MFLENLKFNTSNDYLDDCSIEITLTFVSDALNKNEITTALGIEPTFAWNANEVLELGSSKKIRVADTGKWSLKSVTKIDNLDAGLELFFKNLPKDNNVWLPLTDKYETYIEVTGYTNMWNHSYNISSKTLKLLTAKNVSLSIDVYNMNIDEAYL